VDSPARRESPDSLLLISAVDSPATEKHHSKQPFLVCAFDATRTLFRTEHCSVYLTRHHRYNFIEFNRVDLRSKVILNNDKKNIIV